MKKNLFLSILLLSLIATSCSSNSENDIMNPPPVDNNITYAANVKVIIDNNCIRCHSNPPINSAPMALVTYQNVRDAVSSRGLINRVADGSMPPDGTDLTPSQVQTIRDWQAGGFKQ